MSTNKKFRLGAKASRRLTNAAVYLILIAISVIWLFPFFGIVMESFRIEGTGQKNYIIPQQFGLDNYRYLIMNEDNNGFMQWFLNTATVGIITAFVQTGFILSMSYALSRLRFKMRKGLMNFMLILGMFPGFLTLILIYKVFADLGLTGANASWGLIIVYCASSAMGYYVSKGFFDTIPKSLDEAARVDGATRFQVLYKVILPLSKPIVIYTILMGFMAPWGDYMMANWLSHQVTAGQNVATGMMEWMGRNLEQHYTHFCAGGVIVALPVITVFLLLQKYYVEGVTGGAVKG